MAAALYRCCKLVGRRVSSVPSVRPLVSSFGRVEGYRIHPVVHGRVWYSSGCGPGQVWDSSSYKGFLGKFVENFRQEFRNNQEMKDSLKKFREEARQLEESAALQQARRKYKSIEAETVRTSEVLKNTLGSLAHPVKEVLKEVGRSDVAKMIGKGVAEAAKLGQTGPFRAISQSVESMAKEMDMGDARPYRAPPHLRKRSEFSSMDAGSSSRVLGKIMEQGPVLIITFQAQVVNVIRSPQGDVVEGDPEKVLRMMHVWALCRDQEELDPNAAWRLLDISASSSEQVL